MSDLSSTFDEMEIVNALLSDAAERGYLTYDQILEALPELENNVSLLDAVMEEAQAAARQVVICILGALKAEIGDLSRVTRVVRVFGMVNSAPDFTGQSQVMNAASELLNEVFGERGRHVRSAVGMAALPANLTVEIEMVFEVDAN